MHISPNYHLVEQAIEEKNYTKLTEKINLLPPFEIADLIENQSEHNQILIFRALSASLSLETFDYLPIQIQERLLYASTHIQATTLLNSLSPDDRTNFFQEIPKKSVEKFIKLLPPEEYKLTLTLLSYPEGSIGRLMTPDYIAVKMDWKIEKVLDHIQAFGHDSETLDYIYVIDNQGKLLDNIKLKEFLFIPRQVKVRSLVNKSFIALSVNNDDESAIKIFRQHSRNVLPVIDEKGLLLGIVTIDDILRLSNQEDTEDIQKIGGMEALDEPYMQTPFLELMKKRAGWLVILFLGEMLTATALGYFDEEISKAVVLALFLPLIISSGGNAGSQASTLVIRAMALGEVKLKDWWKILKKEIASGIFLGIILASIGFFRITLWSMFSTIYGEHWMLIAFTVSFSLIGVVLWGTLCGAIFPLILSRAGADPATSSAPFVATLVDVTGVIIYFLISILILQGTLL